MPYTQAESMGALKHFYREHGESLWGEYGFYDAFNLEEGWFAESYLAIDQGPIINMIENFRSGLLWSNFMANEEIAPALAAIGFIEDPVSTDPIDFSGFDVKVYPTINHGEIYLSLDERWDTGDLKLSFSDAVGRKLIHETQLVNDHLLKARLSDQNTIFGWIWVSVYYQNSLVRTYPLWIQ
jgi:hypothetical protein